MLPYIYILHYPIPMYGVMILLGTVGSILMALYIGRKKNLAMIDILFSAFHAMLGVAIGGKIFYLILSIPLLKENWNVFMENPILLIKVLQGGFVFYGGLIGALLFVWFYCRKYRVNMEDVFSVMIPVIPLFHAIGRIGCFCAGCCYGISYNGACSIVYTHAVAGPNGISLFPVQLAESFWNVFIFLFLLLLYYKGKNMWILAGAYGILYGVMRFVLEFFRGDTIRGAFLGLSTSQWISIPIVVCSFYILYVKKTGKNE